MRVILFVLFILCFPASLLAQEFGPHSKMIINYRDEVRNFSGTVIKCDNKKIEIITCWHGTMGTTPIKEMTAFVYDGDLSAKITMSIVKSDPDKDILLLSAPNTNLLKIKSVELADTSLMPEIKCKAYGYALSDTLIENDVIINDYVVYTTPKNAPILSVRAKVISGMSGGGLVHEGKLYGVQSSGKNEKVSYCPSSQILEFLNEN